MKIVVQILALGLSAIFSGCVTLYKPNTVHSPLLHEKGQLNAAATLGVIGSGWCNVQGAYALSPHWGVVVDGMYHGRWFSSADSSVEKLTMLSGEVGTGYFNAFGKGRKGLFQCYGGAGYGQSLDKIIHSSADNPEARAKYFNVFIQPGLAYLSRGFEASFDLKANYVQLFDIYAYLYDQFAWWNTDFQYYSGITLDFLNLEPTTTLKFGNKNLKGLLQLGLTLPVMNAGSYFKVNTSAILLVKFSVGISYTFNPGDL